MASALEMAATDKRKVAALGLQLEIVKSTPMPDSEKRKMLNNLRIDAAALFRSTHPIQDAREPHVAKSASPTLDVAQSSSSDRESASLPGAPSFVVMGHIAHLFSTFRKRDMANSPILILGLVQQSSHTK